MYSGIEIQIEVPVCTCMQKCKLTIAFTSNYIFHYITQIRGRVHAADTMRVQEIVSNQCSGASLISYQTGTERSEYNFKHTVIIYISNCIEVVFRCLFTQTVYLKVILYSYLILKKINERITVNISTNIHNERIKTKYIPSYIFENEGKIFKKLKKLAVFLRNGNCLS